MEKDIRSLLTKVTSTTHDDDNHYSGTVTVTLKDGSVHSETTPTPFGRGDNKMPLDLLKSKYESCASRALPKDQVEELHATLWDLENLKSVRKITDVMTLPTSATQAAE
jgi:hypothetical protein